jgi:hypothetical protein
MLHPETESRAQLRREYPGVLPVSWQPVGAVLVAAPSAGHSALRTATRTPAPTLKANRTRAGCRAAAAVGRGTAKNEVRMKLECHEDSMSCHDFGEPPIGALLSGATAFESAPVLKAAVAPEWSPPGPPKTAGSEVHRGPQEPANGHHPGSQATKRSRNTPENKELAQM